MAVTVAIVTCGPQLEVALAGRGWLAPSVIRLAGGSPRSTLLLAAVDLLVEDAELEPGAIERVLVTRGPGSFTGIRAGLASAAGLAAATGAVAGALDSLTVQAARCEQPGRVWAAQPGRRDEVYARPFEVAPDAPPRPLEALRIVSVGALEESGPWVAAEALDLGRVERAVTARTAVEALLRLAALGVALGPLEPLYVEGPPIDPGAQGR